jgi:glycerol-3-phosphate acyltransferase PlsY
MSSVGSISGAILFPAYVVATTLWSGASLRDRWPFLVFAVTVSIMVIARHRANIARILSGTETKVVRATGETPAKTTPVA